MADTTRTKRRDIGLTVDEFTYVTPKAGEFISRRSRKYRIYIVAVACLVLAIVAAFVLSSPSDQPSDKQAKDSTNPGPYTVGTPPELNFHLPPADCREVEAGLSAQSSLAKEYAARAAAERAIDVYSILAYRGPEAQALTLRAISHATCYGKVSVDLMLSSLREDQALSLPDNRGILRELEGHR